MLSYSCMNIEERKKWLEDRKELIYNHCVNSNRIDMKEYNERFNVSEEEIAKSINDCYELMINDYKDEQSNCSEYVNDICISEYLNKIRNNDYETMICLVIKNNKIIDVFSEKGQYSGCDINHTLIDNSFKKAKTLDAEVCVIHNHPHAVIAKPSGEYKKFKNGFETWIGDQYQMHVEIPNYEKKYNVKCIDYCVVSPVDYYSAKQKKDLL